MVINKIQELYIHLFQINHLVISYMYQKTLSLLKHINQNFKPWKYGLQIKNSQPLETEGKVNLNLVIK